MVTDHLESIDPMRGIVPTQGHWVSRRTHVKDLQSSIAYHEVSIRANDLHISDWFGWTGPTAFERELDRAVLSEQR